MIATLMALVDENRHEMKIFKDKKEIINEFSAIINKYNLENDCNTPDFLLADYLFECLVAANLLICKRSIWYNPEGKE